MLIAGIDEAGRGPVIGSMFIALVVMEEEDTKMLKSEGLTDSKLLSPNTREKFARRARKKAVEVRTCSISPAEIDERSKHNNLNELEVQHIIKLINSLEHHPKKIYIDSMDVIPGRLRDRLQSATKFKCEIIAEHKADLTYPITSAASVVAKSMREEEVAELKKEYGDFGSGYPSDPYCQKWLALRLKEGKELPGIVRKSWGTIQNIEEKEKQRKLLEF